jgi:hypothetical protein
MSAALFDVIDTRTGHVAIRAVPMAGALSAAQTFNTGRNPAPFRVFPTGTYQHKQA